MYIHLNMVVAQFLWLDNYAGLILYIQSVTSYFYFSKFRFIRANVLKKNAHCAIGSIAGFLHLHYDRYLLRPKMKILIDGSHLKN